MKRAVLVALAFAAASIPGGVIEAQATRASPTIEQCHANLSENAVYYDTCPANTRMCPNHLALGVSVCLEQTPAEREAAEREAAMLSARADARRIIERERQRQVDEEAARLGAHRRAEAVRLVEMRLRAEEAQGRAEAAEQLARRLAAMSPQDRAAYERCREVARAGRVTCQ